jgi:hypothetical protein
MRHPDLIARTYRGIQDRAAMGPGEEAVARLAELRRRRDRTQQSIRAALSATQPDVSHGSETSGSDRDFLRQFGVGVYPAIWPPRRVRNRSDVFAAATKRRGVFRGKERRK